IGCRDKEVDRLRHFLSVLPAARRVPRGQKRHPRESRHRHVFAVHPRPKRPIVVLTGREIFEPPLNRPLRRRRDEFQSARLNGLRHLRLSGRPCGKKRSAANYGNRSHAAENLRPRHKEIPELRDEQLPSSYATARVDSSGWPRSNFRKPTPIDQLRRAVSDFWSADQEQFLNYRKTLVNYALLEVDSFYNV